MLTLLDLSAAFDIVDHKTLRHRLEVSSATRFTDGLIRISAIDRTLFAVGHYHRFQRPSCSVSHKGRSWDQSSSFFIQQI